MEDAAKEIIVNYPDIIQRMNELKYLSYCYYGDFVRQRIDILNECIEAHRDTPEEKEL